VSFSTLFLVLFLTAIAMAMAVRRCCFWVMVNYYGVMYHTTREKTKKIQAVAF
jgi:hypothetical protein